MVILAIDQGTTNSKAILVDKTGRIVSRGSAPVPIYHPQPGWVEQQPIEIWHSVCDAIAACLTDFGDKNIARQIAAVGISNQRESVLAWHAKTGEPLGPCVSWQCKRTAAACDTLRQQGVEEDVQRKTGLPIDPMFAATKAAWLFQHTDTNDICLGTVDSWLLWCLTDHKTHACDETNAARTQLLDLASGHWNQDLCDTFGVPMNVLPNVHPSDMCFGVTKNVPNLPDGIPIHAMIGDSHAALFGHGITSTGMVKATYGTGSSLMTPLTTFTPPDQGITTTIAWNVNNTRTYAFEGNILVSASSLPWTADLLGLADTAALADLATTVDDTGGVYLVPAFVGLGAPHWDSDTRAILCGMTFNTKPAEVARAAMESIALQVADVFDAMNAQSPQPLTRLLTDGGPTANHWLMQLQADVLGVPVAPSEAPEASARGAAYIAGLGVGMWDTPNNIPELTSKGREFTPQWQARKRTQHRRSWRHALAQARLPIE